MKSGITISVLVFAVLFGLYFENEANFDSQSGTVEKQLAAVRESIDTIKSAETPEEPEEAAPEAAAEPIAAEPESASASIEDTSPVQSSENESVRARLGAANEAAEEAETVAVEEQPLLEEKENDSVQAAALELPQQESQSTSEEEKAESEPGKEQLQNSEVQVFKSRFPEPTSGYSRLTEDGAVIYFDIGGSTLSSSAREALREFVARVEAAPAAELSIRGYTDSSRTEQALTGLSSSRAAVVAEALRSLGVKAPISSASLESSDPAASNETPLGRMENRRVEIELEEAAG